MTTAQVINLVGVLIASGTVTLLFNWLRSLRTARTDNTVHLSDAAVRQVQAAMAQVDQFQERVVQAEQAARDAELASNDARRESDNLRRELYQVTDAAAQLERRMNRLAEMIHDPQMTLDKLRLMITPPQRNGTT